MAANRITNYIAKLMPSWLDFRVLKALTGQADAWVDDALNAKRQAYIETQDGPLLDLSARNSGDRRLQYRFPTPESDDQLRAYLRTRWTQHLRAGTLDALDAQVQRWGFSKYTWVDELSLRAAGYTGAFGNDADGLVPGTLPTDPPLAPGPGSGFFAIILHPPHYFSLPEEWDVTAKLWDDPGFWWDFGPVYGYPGVAPNAVLKDFAALMGGWRQGGSSLRHVVVDFAGDCVVDNGTASGYSGSTFVVWPNWEPNEQLPDGTYPARYNLGWKSP